MKKKLLSILLIGFSIGSNAQCYENISFWGHTVAEKEDGTLWGWGSSSWGNLSTNNGNEGEPNPIQIGILNEWNKIYLGGSRTFAIKNNGTLWGCGSNQHGALGVIQVLKISLVFNKLQH